MAITWSRLHERLGVQVARPLSVADIVQAIALDLDEDEALDFKAQLRSDEAAKVELAKDVAAMANSGGGLIVVGVGEEGEEKHLVAAPYQIPAEPEQAIHQLLASRVRPLVRPVVEAIRGDGETSGYLLIQVPDSPAAPHFYEHNPDQRTPPGAPFRHGSGTLMMREYDLERAYRDRFARQSNRLVGLEHLVQETTDRLGFTEGDARHWAIVATSPLSSPPLGALRPDAEAVHGAREAARRREFALYKDGEGSGLLSGLVDPRRGLHRWIMRNAFTDREATSTTQTYAELHDDGSSVLAFPVASTPTEYDGRKEPRSAIKATYVQVVCASAVVLADAWLMTQRITAEASMLASIVTSPVDTEPVWAISDVPGGRARILPTTRPLTRILPVDTFLAFPRDLPRMRAAAMDLAESILHQFGIEHLNQLALPED